MKQYITPAIITIATPRTSLCAGSGTGTILPSGDTNPDNITIGTSDQEIQNSGDIKARNILDLDWE